MFKVGDRVFHVNRLKVCKVIKVTQVDAEIELLNDDHLGGKKGEIKYVTFRVLRKLTKLERALA